MGYPHCGLRAADFRPDPRVDQVTDGRADIPVGSLARRAERGSVTAEAAIVLPIMAAFALTLIWMISLGIAHVLVVDAARDAAREIARGGDIASAVSRAHETAHADAHVTVHTQDGLATVDVSYAVTPPGWLLVPMPVVDVEASSTVEVEGGHG